MLAKVQASVASMMRPAVLLDLFRFFTLFSTDKRNRKIKVVCRYQQYEGANMIVDRVRAGYPKKGLWAMEKRVLLKAIAPVAELFSFPKGWEEHLQPQKMFVTRQKREMCWQKRSLKNPPVDWVRDFPS